MKLLVVPAMAALIFTPVLASAEPLSATAQMVSEDKKDAGTVTLTQIAGGVLLKAELTGLPEGVHAFHIHAVGDCDPAKFKSAKGHFNPTSAEHGFLNEKGPHAGDMPNFLVAGDSGEGGIVTFDVLNLMVSLKEGDEGYLFDGDGAAIMVHAGADDYKTDPAGAAGSRIACGEIEMD